MKINSKIIKNIFYLFFGNIFTKLFSAVATIIYAKYTGAPEYGILSVALSFTAIATYFTDCGIAQTTIREGTKDGANIGSIIYSYFVFRLRLLVITSLGSMLIISIFYNEIDMKLSLLYMLIPSLIGSLLQGIGLVYFQITENMKFNSFINISYSVVNSLVLVVGVGLQLPIYIICLFYGVSSMLAGLLSILFVRKRLTFVRLKQKSINKDVLLFTINGLIVMLIPQLGPLIIEKVLSVESVGFYSAAFKIPSVLYQFPAIIATAFYPRLFNLGNRNLLEEHKKMSGYELQAMTLLGIILSLPFVLEPVFWIYSLLGSRWMQSATLLVVLSYLVILQAIKYPLADYLTTADKQKSRTMIMLIALLLSVTLYVFLPKAYGLNGAAFAPVITEIITIILLIMAIPKGVSFFVKNLFSILSCFISVLFVSRFIHVQPLLRIVIIEGLFMIMVFIVNKEFRLKISEKINRQFINKK